MKIYIYKLGDRLPVKSSAVAIGFFDGVHLAHRELILTAKDEAARLGIASGVVTFASESSIKSGIARLYDTDDKLSLIEKLGVDFAVVCDFGDVASMTGEEFVSQVIVRDIGASRVVAGYNFRFGNHASSNADDLCRYMRALGGDAIIKEPYLYGKEPLSSSMIRGFLSDGKVEEARKALGYPYFVSGRVSHGNGVGKTLGFPTLNFPDVSGRIKLKQGVYRCAALVLGKLYHAVTNVGVCPTFDKREYHIEANIADFSGDIYGKSVRLYFLGFLREEKRFSSQDELKMQIKVDKTKAIKENEEDLWQEIGLS